MKKRLLALATGIFLSWLIVIVCILGLVEAVGYAIDLIMEAVGG